MRYLRFRIRASGHTTFDEPAKYVVDGSLDFLDARYVVRADDNRVVSQTLAQDPTPVVAHDADRQQAPFSGFGERGEYVGRAPARRDTDRDVLGPRVGDELAGEDRLRTDIVGYGRNVGRLGRQGDRRNRTQALRWVHTVRDKVVRVRGRSAVSENDQLSAPLQPFGDGSGRLGDGVGLRFGGRGAQAVHLLHLLEHRTLHLTYDLFEWLLALAKEGIEE